MSNIKTTREAIVEYWGSRIDEGDTGTDWDEALNRCWRCGDWHGNLDRCHIIAAQDYGPDEPSNFVLLCGPCHGEAPMVLDPTFMWHWIKATHEAHYGAFWQIRLMAEYKRLFGEEFRPSEQALNEFTVLCERAKHLPPTEQMKAEKIAAKQTSFFSHLTSAYEDAGIHFGHCVPPISLATRAWILRQAVLLCGNQNEKGTKKVGTEKQ
jgi:hypothetical protein